jgi:hypothetical protein
MNVFTPELLKLPAAARNLHYLDRIHTLCLGQITKQTNKQTNKHLTDTVEQKPRSGQSNHTNAPTPQNTCH